jgi:hypothetical protein
MAEHVLMAGSTAAGPQPGPRPGRGGQRWRSAVFLLVLVGCLAAITVLVMVVAPSAGAAGGCGGG